MTRGAALAVMGLLAAQRLPGQDSTIFQRDAAATKARTAGDWARYRYQVLKIDSLLGGGNPRVTVALARAEARLGHRAAALELLADFAATGLVRGIETDSDFVVTLRNDPGWGPLIERLRRNGDTQGRAEVAFVLPDSDFVAEDIAWDGASGRTFVSSIRHRKVAVLDRSGRARDFIPEGRDSLRAVLAVAVDRPHAMLWITSAGSPQSVGYAVADSGWAALLSYDLSSGALRRRYELPASARKREPGDIVVATNGDVYIGDGAVGAVYVYRRNRDAVETLIPPGEIISPQQAALSPDERTLYVADYARGIAAVDLTSKSVRYVAQSRRVAATGIDGLLLVNGKLIGVQNGVDPARVVQLDLSATELALRSSEVLAQGLPWLVEPTHAARAGCALLVIGNSGSAAYDQAGARLPAVKLDAPRILRIPLGC
jgi:sugar lactone lactonase YvrE